MGKICDFIWVQLCLPLKKVYLYTNTVNINIIKQLFTNLVYIQFTLFLFLSDMMFAFDESIDGRPPSQTFQTLKSITPSASPTRSILSTSNGVGRTGGVGTTATGAVATGGIGVTSGNRARGHSCVSAISSEDEFTTNPGLHPTLPAGSGLSPASSPRRRSSTGLRWTTGFCTKLGPRASNEDRLVALPNLIEALQQGLEAGVPNFNGSVNGGKGTIGPGSVTSGSSSTSRQVE